LRSIRHLTILLILAASCRHTPYYRLTTECHEPAERLEHYWHELSEARAKPGACDVVSQGTGRCNQLRQDIARLAFVCPAYEPVQLANAILAYDEKALAKAQQTLDSLLSTPGIHPEAAQLRARIALDEGNVPYALRFLGEQISLNPDSAALRETYGAALYLSSRYDEAKDALATAARLGTPRSRIAYDLGLIAEAQGNTAEAEQLYEEALQLNPSWAPADSRLKGLRARRP
jgi:predicted Zn-dependent protease